MNPNVGIVILVILWLLHASRCRGNVFDKHEVRGLDSGMNAQPAAAPIQPRPASPFLARIASPALSADELRRKYTDMEQQELSLIEDAKRKRDAAIAKAEAELARELAECQAALVNIREERRAALLAAY